MSNYQPISTSEFCCEIELVVRLNPSVLAYLDLGLPNVILQLLLQARQIQEFLLCSVPS